jgi:UDP-N-acetylglucosamine--N-acetylmuramyl-(pentapeptide) pyrophosphoryl-undecaprenol N-acetylglucosamine transferase
MSTPVVIFAGGGTAGHIHPALAVWEELQDLLAARGLAARAHFLCSMRPVDQRTLEPEGVPFTRTPANYPSPRPRQLWRFLSGWPASVRVARATIAHARETGPVCMVTMGGFVAAPAVQAARVERVPVTLVNIDAVAGKANRFIATRAQRAFTTVPQARYPGWMTIAPVVRRAARLQDPSPQGRVQAQALAQRSLGLIEPGREPRKVLLVTGGSLGARSLNELMGELVEHDAGVLAGWHVLHQTGADDATQALTDRYQRAGVSATVRTFHSPLAAWWLAADLALSRAGAGAVSEARASATPTLFMPYPFHADMHQLKNAGPLHEAGMARVVDDLVDAQRNRAQAGAQLAALLTDAPARALMRRAAMALARASGPSDGALTIAEAMVPWVEGRG